MVGTWSFLGACANLAALDDQAQQACAGQTVNSDALSLTGLLTFNADNSYTATGWRETFLTSVTVPLSCAGTTTCAAASGTTNLNSSSATGTTTTTCGGTSTCACSVRGSLNVTSETGTYYISSGTFLQMFGDVTGANFNYCVDGNDLHLMQTVTETLVTPQGTTTTIIALSDIVAERR